MKDIWTTKFFGVKHPNPVKDTRNETTNKSEDVINVPLKLIDRSPYQPRENIDIEKVDELAQSIKTYGLLQPIVVRKVRGRYEIVAGERRYLALKKLKSDSVKAIVKDYNDSEIAALAMIENLQRENLNIIEEAMGYRKLIEEFNLTQEALAQRLGKSQSTIANKLRLLNLPQQVKKYLSNGEITERHARSLLKISDRDKQLELLERIIAEGLNVKQTEERIRLKEISNENTGTTNSGVKSKSIKQGIVKDYRIFVNTINSAIATIKNAGLDPVVNEENYEDRIEIKITLPKNIC